MDKISISKIVHQEMIVNDVLEIESNTKVQLKNTRNIKIIAKDNNEIECGDHCEIVCGDHCEIKCGDYCNVACGNYCNIKFISDNIIKTGKFCILNGNNENTIKVKNGSRVHIINDCEITIKGKNIILEVKGENGIIHNRAKDSIIITHSVRGKIKVYKSNKLIDEEEIEIENGEISLDYDKRYLTINNS